MVQFCHPQKEKPSKHQQNSIYMIYASIATHNACTYQNYIYNTNENQKTKKQPYQKDLTKTSIIYKST